MASMNKLLSFLRRHLARARAVGRARRAIQKLFCRHCGRDLFTRPAIAVVYCSYDCADRDVARLEFGAQIY